MKGKITFNKNGNGSSNAKLIIPKAFIELIEITEDNREVEITFKNGKLIIEKLNN